MKSYGSINLGIFSRIKELYYIYRQHSDNPREKISIQINRIKKMEYEIRENFWEKNDRYRTTISICTQARTWRESIALFGS